jgi:ribonuclease VapC
VSVVLDASALLAYWLDEAGADVVTAEIAGAGAMISAPNFAEALTKLVDRRPGLAAKLPVVPTHQVDELGATLPGIPLAGGAISVEPFTAMDAVQCATLRPQTKQLGLSLGDRACLALGKRMGFRVLTADRAWASLSVGVEVIVIR